MSESLKEGAWHSGTPYPMTKSKKDIETRQQGPSCSGVYKGTSSEYSAANLELKIDVDRLRDYSPVLQIVSGSITKGDGAFPWLESHNGIFFRSIKGTVVMTKGNGANNARKITCDIQATRSDGETYGGKVEIDLMLPQDTNVWQGKAKIEMSGESVTFDIQRSSLFFRQVTLDVDYVDKVVWPTISLADFHSSPPNMINRKLDPFAAFEDAGVQLLYDEKDSDKIADPTPHNPWTKSDMYNLMMENFDAAEEITDNAIWCMMATKPPDQRYMGFSFDQEGRKGFGIFTGHKSFKGLLDEKEKNHAYASRRFLHYFVHECGHSLGLLHPFEIGRPSDLTWMNYGWKYDAIHGPTRFYEEFAYTFTDVELAVIRHCPSQDFNQYKKSSVHIGNYGVVKSFPAENDLEEEDLAGDEKSKLVLKIKIRPEPYNIMDLVEVEVRVKNEGNKAVMVEKDLDLDSGNLIVYINYPDGSIDKIDSFVRPIAGVASNPLILYPPGEGEGSDRYSHMISIGEGSNGSYFSQAGTYTIKVAYTGGKSYILSNTLNLVITKPDEKGIDMKKMNAAAKLEGSSHIRFKDSVEAWKKIASLSVQDKKKKVVNIVLMAEGMTKQENRVSSVGSKKGTKRKRKTMSKTTSALISHEYLIGTKDLVAYYKNQGEKRDSINYKQLVFTRAKLMIKEGVKEKAELEFNQLLTDLVSRGVKYATIKSINEEWKNLTKPDVDVDKTSAKYLQARVEEILEWFPKKKIKNETELSGLGLNKPFSHFNDDHVSAASKIVLMLFNHLDETNDLAEVLEYADNLQRGYQVNHQVLQWAVEIFTVHSEHAKKSGIMYPVPQDRDASVEAAAAMIVTQRTGTPREAWMHYWRSDADLNYHHRHWHTVYIVGREIGRNNWFGRWRRNRPELIRQGELFGYMHQQMLARYNAERESWGLREAQPWRYGDRDSDGFNAGFEFHNHPQNSSFFSRPPGSWPQSSINTFLPWENSYRNAVSTGVLPPVVIAGETQPRRFRLDYNLSGHVIEASSSTWRDTIGTIHNAGHGVFGSNRVTSGQSYMSSTETAMRDPIFYRWHTHVDDLWQMWINTQITEVAADAPPVIIRDSDIVIKTSSQPLDNFESFASDNFASDELTTFLGPPQKRFEWDNKIDHDPFYYHIRFKRSAPGNLNLTFRIFICPTRHISSRKKWIEMDKFIFRLPSNQDSATIIRSDRHSAVIKREPRFMEGNVESNVTTLANGFCECGWPYSMLLPRGTSRGEQWSVCVYVSNNDIDSIGITSSCGSLSFCGASGQRYPDSRPMGYPFTSDIMVNGQEMPIPNAIATLSNAAINSFVIRNNITTSPPIQAIDMWSPWVQLGLDDGAVSPGGDSVATYSTSRIVGRMRVLIDDAAMTRTNTSGLINVRFQGRGPGGGSYRINRPYIGYRDRTTPNLRPDIPVANLTVSEQSSFDVPEGGIISDQVMLRPGTGDMFVTFTLESPGCFLRGSSNQQTSTYVIFNPSGDTATSDIWSNLPGVRITPSIYCVGGVMVPLPTNR